MKKILVVFGTRPEAIKMAPVVKALKNKKFFNVKVCVTAQHREMLDQVMDIFALQADYDLDIMKKDQDLYSVSSKILLEMKDVLLDFLPDIVLVHGDTTTCSIASLASFYQKISIGHVEAGLRTGDIYSPWPEEANRLLTGVLAKYHFAPTQTSKNNLIKENKAEDTILITGNTGIDALFLTLEHIENNESVKQTILTRIEAEYTFIETRKIILVTGHRRENFGDSFINICQALKTIALNHPTIDIVYPVHLNPHVQKPVYELLSNVDNIFLIKPMEYESFVYLMNKAYFIITDSGGVQEEAPSLGKPVLLMRETTERPEAVIAGTVKLVGTDKNTIIDAADQLLRDQKIYDEMNQAINPYGDGKASERIANYLKDKI